MSIKKIILLGAIILVLPSVAFGITPSISIGERAEFFIEPEYDYQNREEISAVLQKIGKRAYFYIDSGWWDSLTPQEKQEVDGALYSLNGEFEVRVYPTLTSQFGSEWKPGIDEDGRITILIHPMEERVRGYFRHADEHFQLQSPTSNEREMVYLSAEHIGGPLAKTYLAQEFLHLITFNQKLRLRQTREQTWLNELRAEYVPTMLNYNVKYEKSYLNERVDQFLEDSVDSIVEWGNDSSDYASVNLFGHYLVDHYGVDVLVDSLHSGKTGIESINEALKENDFEVDFSQVFTDWTITALVNNCSLGDKYCYKNENLKDFRITPSTNFLPLHGKSSLGLNQESRNWSARWFKFIGGKKEAALKVQFIGNPDNVFKIPYVTKNISGEYSLGFFDLNEYQRGDILVPDFGTKVTSVTIIPSVQTKISDFSTSEPGAPFFWEASTVMQEGDENGDEDQDQDSGSGYLDKPIERMDRQEIIEVISEIENLLSQLKERLSEFSSEPSTPETPLNCERFEEDLYYGMRNEDQVRCLQQFLKSQGEQIYPEGLVTGNFLSLTKSAVIRFQEKHAEDVLEPWNLEQGTGYVGETTRAKINQILSQQ